MKTIYEKKKYLFYNLIKQIIKLKYTLGLLFQFEKIF